MGYGIAEWMDGHLEELIQIENLIMSAQRAEIMALTEACRILEVRKEPYLQIQLMGLECVTIMEKYGLEIILGRLMGNQLSMKKRSICYNHAWGPRN